MKMWFDETINWQFCKRFGCLHRVTHDSMDYCYPHSRWYRPAKRLINPIIDALLDLKDYLKTPNSPKEKNKCLKTK